MNEREAFAIIRNVLRLEGLARKIAVESNKELRQALKYVQEIVRGMPEGSVEREIFYQQVRDLIGNTFQTPSNRLQDDLTSGLLAESEQQAEWAASYVNRVADSSMKAAALNSLDRVRVLDKPLDKLFNGLGLVNARYVNTVVQKGFLEGWTNKQIADEITKQLGKMVAQNRALARTAVMSMAQETHNAIWDANADVIVGWVFDASMDFRVCPRCAPRDGKRVKRRNQLPSVPIHPNCRCMVLPRTSIEPDEGDRAIIEMIPEDQMKRIASKRDLSVNKFLKQHLAERRAIDDGDLSVRYYQKPVTIDGKRFYRRVTDVAPQKGQALSMGGFVYKANKPTRQNVLGKYRAQWFDDHVKPGMSQDELQDVLREATKQVPPKRRAK